MGGLELANLWPAIPSDTRNGVTLTALGDGSYTTSGEFSTWATFEQTLTLEAGRYTIDGSSGLTSLNSWDLILQIAPAPIGDALIKPGTPATSLPAGTYRAQINVNSQSGIGRTITPILVKID